MLTALREHSALILGGIHSTIGETSHLPRAGMVQQVLTALEESQVVLLSGPAGIGKSAIGKEVVTILSRDHFSFAFRAEEFAQPHFDATLTLGNIPGRAATLGSVLAAQERKILVVESVERLLEKSTRDAFADLLTIAADDPTFRTHPHVPGLFCRPCSDRVLERRRGGSCSRTCVSAFGRGIKRG